MPLRVSSDWASDMMDVKKNAQHVKIKKPSRPELYQDAARILEELFAKRLEDQLPHRRHQTVPLPIQVVQVPVDIICERGALEERRAHTLPSNSRQYINQGLKQRDVNTLRRKTSDTQHSADAGSISSADTEGDSSSVTEKRRKKTLFRKAKDRLLHAFHRQARERDADLKDEDRGDKSRAKGKSLKKASPKHKGKEKKGVVESVVRGLSTKKDNSDGSQSVRSEEKNGSQLPQTEIDRRKNSAGIGLIKSIRRSLRVSNKKEKVCPPEGSSVDGSSKTATSQGSPDSLPPYSPQAVAQSNSTAAHRQTAYGLAPVRHDQGLVVSPGRNSPSPFPQSTSTDSHHDSGNKSSSIHSLASAHGDSSTSAKNVLDDPGEDIQFMDDDGRIRSRHASGNDKRSSTIFFQIPPPMVTVDSGYSNNGTTSPIYLPPPPPPPPTGGSIKLQRCVSLQVDGDANDGAGEGASGDVPFHKKTHEEKEKLYSKIAQKLITIADAFSAESVLSDSEAHHKTGHQEAAVGLADLENLEKELIECLRGKGDELSHKIDGPAEKLVEQTKARTYERFERTIQHSLGNEVSWNHLALLFYSTRAVVKAVGRSSDAATEVTEMTLRYFSDKLANWIIDQGGFETLAESDSELD